MRWERERPHGRSLFPFMGRGAQGRAFAWQETGLAFRERPMPCFVKEKTPYSFQEGSMSFLSKPPEQRPFGQWTDMDVFWTSAGSLARAFSHVLRGGHVRTIRDLAGNRPLSRSHGSAAPHMCGGPAGGVGCGVGGEFRVRR